MVLRHTIESFMSHSEQEWVGNQHVVLKKVWNRNAFTRNFAMVGHQILKQFNQM